MAFRTFAVALVTMGVTSLFAYDAFAQSGLTQGSVTDTWGNPLEGVEIEIQREDGGGEMRTAVTDEDGEFQLIGLDGAAYRFVYRLEGYQGAAQIREVSSRGFSSRRRSRPSPVALELDGGGVFLQDDTEFEAEGGRPSLKLTPEGMFEFEDAEGEGEGNYSIQELNAILIVRDYDGPDDKYTITEPVVVTAPTNQFMSLVWGDMTLNKK